MFPLSLPGSLCMRNSTAEKRRRQPNQEFLLASLRVYNLELLHEVILQEPSEKKFSLFQDLHGTFANDQR